MFMSLKGTDRGLELRLVIAWSSFLKFIKALLITVAAISLLLTTPVGIAVMGFIQSLLS